MKQNYEQIFNADERNVIARFVQFVADSNNQSNAGKFSDVTETDESVAAEVREWLENRYKRGHGRRRDS
jgi:hypothetical protein